MYRSKGSTGLGRADGISILSALKATEMIDSRANLPAGIITENYRDHGDTIEANASVFLQKSWSPSWITCRSLIRFDVQECPEGYKRWYTTIRDGFLG